MMSDQLSLEPGALPWQPSNDAHLGEVFDRYDRPLIGLLEQGGHRFLFFCVAGRTEDWNVWAYTRLEEEEAGLLASAPDFEAALRTVGTTKSFVLAVASDEAGVVEATQVEHSDELPGAAHSLLASLGVAGRLSTIPWRRETTSAGTWQPMTEGLESNNVSFRGAVARWTRESNFGVEGELLRQ
jgi:hypothetical protein